jgi:hypothetical protein
MKVRESNQPKVKPHHGGFSRLRVKQKTIKEGPRRLHKIYKSREGILPPVLYRQTFVRRYNIRAGFEPTTTSLPLVMIAVLHYAWILFHPFLRCICCLQGNYDFASLYNSCSSFNVRTLITKWLPLPALTPKCRAGRLDSQPARSSFYHSNGS